MNIDRLVGSYDVEIDLEDLIRISISNSSMIDLYFNNYWWEYRKFVKENDYKDIEYYKNIIEKIDDLVGCSEIYKENVYFIIWVYYNVIMTKKLNKQAYDEIKTYIDFMNNYY